MPTGPSPILLQPSPSLSLPEFWHLVQGAPVRISAALSESLAGCRAFLDRQIEERRCIYGITTGYGPLAGVAVEPSQIVELQYRLLCHLATGVGAPFSPMASRAILAARLLNICRGHSGASPAVVTLMADCLNRGLAPVIPCMGTVGASGDLTPLAHMTLALMGQGEMYCDGRKMPAHEALALAGLTPLGLDGRDALALVNGTSAMTALAACNGYLASRALHLAIQIGAVYVEALAGRAEAFHPALASLRPHPGQTAVTQRLRRALASSRRVQPFHGPAQLPSSAQASQGLHAVRTVPQDPYSLRTLPQLLGAIHDQIRFHQEVVTVELQSVTDNPSFFPAEELVIHGGNFQGQHVSFASDNLNLALIQMAVVLERQIARITDQSLSQGLPAFLQGNRTGLNSGFMGAQVTASAIVAEMRSKALPVSVQSIPTNANNQDIVSMGTIAARRTAEQIVHLYDLLAIASLVMTQAAELIGFDQFSVPAQALCTYVRSFSPFLADDRPLSGEIGRLSTALQSAEEPAFLL